MSVKDSCGNYVTSTSAKEATATRDPEMDVRFTDILIDGKRIADDDENFFHSDPKMDAPHSAPHSRSSSFKNRPRPKLNLDILAAQRPRTNSLPDAYLPLPDPLYMPETGRVQRVRSFKTTSKGLVNHGDSLKKSSNSLSSTGSVGSISNKIKKSARRSRHDSDGSETKEAQAPSTNHNLHVYRVLMMGAPRVGKTSLTRQFMTSEYKGTYMEPNTPDILEPERNVSVLLDGQESTLHFLNEEQHPDFEGEEIPIDAFVVVFSVTNIVSYNHAIKSIRKLREEYRINKAVILVGNKIDLVRQRRVARHDVLRIAKKFDLRYTETSAALNHHVDELLVGILSQIRQQLAPNGSSPPVPSTEPKYRSRSKSPRNALTGFFAKMFGVGTRKVKSCEMLFVQ